jgi:hypothetical protein
MAADITCPTGHQYGHAFSPLQAFVRNLLYLHDLTQIGAKMRRLDGIGKENA